MAADRISRPPLATVGGFLGAGKTTAVNALLAQAEGRRIVVFVNDFGAINIDVELIETVAADRISLRNGCVCCSLNGDFVAAVAEFARRPDPPDGFVVEASGVADPRALDASLAALEGAGLIAPGARLYVLDADAFGSLGYAAAEDIIDHAAASDVVLLNKADLTDDTRLAQLEETLAEAAPYAHVLRTIRGAVPFDLMLDTRPHHAPDRPSTKPHHDDAYERWSARATKPVDRNAFDAFTAALPGHCLRAKGVLRFADAPQQAFLFNLVGRRATLEAIARTGDGDGARFVAIGPRGHLNTDVIETAFQALYDI